VRALFPAGQPNVNPSCAIVVFRNGTMASMEIRPTSNADRANMRRTAKKEASDGAGGFSVPVQGEVHAQVVSGPGPITALDSLLALQELDDATDGRSKGLKRGEHLLDMLDQVRDGLLSGGIPRATLHRLASAVEQRQDEFADPGLQGVLDEIELRAKVELAKLEMSDKTGETF
jgi:hypothetical protein